MWIWKIVQVLTKYIFKRRFKGGAKASLPLEAPLNKCLSRVGKKGIRSREASRHVKQFTDLRSSRVQCLNHFRHKGSSLEASRDVKQFTVLEGPCELCLSHFGQVGSSHMGSRDLKQSMTLKRSLKQLLSFLRGFRCEGIKTKRAPPNGDHHAWGLP
ncbi:hypothetical protein KY285_010853 [Solanum tuberosum]|nr:hypothetical protein KY285_010853 [Solanum tuberosum]